MREHCTFCALPSERVECGTELTITLKDGYPISPGHTLVIPKRHVQSFFDLTEEEKIQLFQAIEQAKIVLDKSHAPDAYNIGINDGEMAGQTVMHLHIHLIPRYQGDVPDPRGGVRWLFPDKADYWTT